MVKKDLITLKKFNVYEKIRLGGRINMWNYVKVIKASKNKLNEDDIREITNNFKNYREIYGVE